MQTNFWVLLLLLIGTARGFHSEGSALLLLTNAASNQSTGSVCKQHLQELQSEWKAGTVWAIKSKKCARNKFVIKIKNTRQVSKTG